MLITLPPLQLPASIALMGRTVGVYLLKLVFPECGVPDQIVTLAALVVIGITSTCM